MAVKWTAKLPALIMSLLLLLASLWLGARGWVRIAFVLLALSVASVLYSTKIHSWCVVDDGIMAWGQKAWGENSFGGCVHGTLLEYGIYNALSGYGWRKVQ